MEVWLESLSMHLSVGKPLPSDLVFDIDHFQGLSPSSSGSTTPETLASIKERQGSIKKSPLDTVIIEPETNPPLEEKVTIIPRKEKTTFNRRHSRSMRDSGVCADYEDASLGRNNSFRYGKNLPKVHSNNNVMILPLSKSDEFTTAPHEAKYSRQISDSIILEKDRVEDRKSRYNSVEELGYLPVKSTRSIDKTLIRTMEDIRKQLIDLQQKSNYYDIEKVKSLTSSDESLINNSVYAKSWNKCCDSNASTSSAIPTSSNVVKGIVDSLNRMGSNDRKTKVICFKNKFSKPNSSVGTGKFIQRDGNESNLINSRCDSPPIETTAL